jgi:hypothetical protein
LTTILRFIALFVVLTLSLLPGVSGAVVMYDEGREIIDGVSFLRDKEDSNAYYYLPTAPRVVLDPQSGKPKILAVKFVDTDGQTSGGIVHFLFSLELPPERIEELQTALAKKVPGATIKGPVTLRAEGDEEAAGASFSIISSTLSDTNDTNSFTASVVSSGVAPVTPGSQAAVAARLTENGATLLFDSLGQETSDVSVALTASYEAALPAYRGRVFASLDTVYEHLFKVMNQQQNYTKTEIRRQIDEMVRTGLIEVDVTDRNGLGIDTSQMSGIMNLVTDKLVNMLFDTTQGLSKLPEPEQVPEDVVKGRQERGFLAKLFAGTGNQQYVTDDQYTMRERQDIKRATFSMVFTQNTTIRVPFNTTGNISGLHELYGEDEELFRIVGLDDEAFDRREVFFEVDPGYYSAFQDNINSVSVSFAKKYPADMDQADFTAEVVFNQKDVRDGTFSKSIVYPRLGIEGSDWHDYEFRTLWSFRGGRTIGIPAEFDDKEKHNAPSITLAPPATLTRIEVDGDARSMVDAEIRRAMVQFNYRLLGQTKKTNVVLHPGETEILQQASLLHDATDPVTYRIRWYRNNGERMDSEWTTLDDTYLFLHPGPGE